MILVMLLCLGLQVQSPSAPKVQKDKATKNKRVQKKAAQTQLKPTRKVVYKTVGSTKLKLHIFEPKNHQADSKKPAVVFFFGGGWNGGNPNQFYPHCQHLAERGMVAMSAEYRVKSRNKTTPFECVADGKSAMRYIRQHAPKLGVDPKLIVAGGGSAGGHVAAAVATVKGLNEKGEDTSVSCMPVALVLFNPVYDNGPKGYGYGRVKDRFREISPMHNISKDMPPAIVFLGTQDRLIPVATGENFRDSMKAVGVRSELKLFKDRGHGFFNPRKKDDTDYQKTLVQMDAFLRSLKIIK